MDALSLCMGCMSPRGEAEVCARCGYSEGTLPESPLHLTPRTVLFNQYLVGKVIGHGGFGITYIGWDLNLQRRLAVKEYFPAGVAIRSGNASVSTYRGKTQQDFDYGLDRYLEEARLVVRFSHHPNILSVINFFRENGTAYIVMEYLEGKTFEQFIADRGSRIDFEEALRVLNPVMDALHEVHQSSVLHRDVSPDNIHIGRDRQVKLLDFGAARLALGERSRNLSVILKEGYAPEEQYRSKGNQGPWTDVYALAATLYRAVTGVLPPGALDRMSGDEMKPPREYDPSITPEQQQAILKALSVDVQNRYSSIRDFRMALDPAWRAPEERIDLSAPKPRSQQPTDLAPTVRKTPTGEQQSASASSRQQQPVSVQPTHAPATSSAANLRIPIWVWSALGGIVVIGTLILLRPRSSTPPVVPQTTTQVIAQAPVQPTPIVHQQQPPSTAPASPATPAPESSTKVDAAKPVTEPPKPAAPRYEDLIHQAVQAETANAADAERILRDAINMNPVRWEAHNQLAQLLLYKLDRAAEAYPAYLKAVEFGGVATFRVMHVHREGDPGDARINVGKDTVALEEPGQPNHAVTAKKADIRELRPNRDAFKRFRGAGGPIMFHVQLQSGERSNFAGSSPNPIVEREMIIRLAGQK